MKWKIHNVFHMSLLKQNTTKKRQVDNKALPEPENEFEARDDKEDEIKTIIKSAVYGPQANNNEMPGLYYLVLWKGYPEEINTWEPSSAVIHFRKLISTFHKEYSEKSTTTSPLLDSASLMAKPTVSKELK